MPSLQNAVTVITGASSGIGKASALAFARAGARLVLAARRAEPLEETARECRQLGAEAIAVVTDVTDEVAVQALAQAAIEAHGRIDVWFNNVGTGVVGPYWEALLDLQKRVVETNLMGTLHGAHAVLPHFLRERRGVLVNMVSMGGWSPTPFAATYAASKYGIRGFSASLRQELTGYPDIHVCGVFPALVDTPGLAHGANFSGRAIDPPGPFLTPEHVAEVVVGLVRRPRAEVAVGLPATAARIAYGIAPVLTERGVGAAMRAALRRARPDTRSEGAVARTVPTGTGTRSGKPVWHVRGPSLGGVALGGLGLLVGAELLAGVLTRRG
ncbi:SDR family oxidoreductase [Paracraurococcus lichenis]|uniref:SDR family oxidoreductase n=1 Tax=Paracraurococcus lichenis TaxID=3064888 RepID=A0ABT9E6P9_9PROT|nr:SDR family oxidoreductase [Paracraurococcus sp. LOR1-02]MDO9711725.1 SDR family oxidoreductase [Paracraurococcus sp. LOR1-02]